MPDEINPVLDLVFERVVPVRRELLWKAWTTPDLLMQWFCPLPWKVTECQLDLRPGGRFRTVMRGPAGEVHDNVGVYLEVVAPERLVWTDALVPGWRPAEKPFFTGIITFTPEGAGTRYHALGRHASEAVRRQHEELGFHEGWGKALDQLVALAKTL